MCVSSLIVSASLQPHGTVVQAPLSMEFSRQEYWSGLPSPRDLPNSGIEPASSVLADGFFTTEPPGQLHLAYFIL